MKSIFYTLFFLSFSFLAHAQLAYLSRGGAVVVVDIPSQVILNSILISGSGVQSAIAVSPDGTRVYSVDQTAGKLQVINAITNQVIGAVTIATSPNAVVVSPDGSKAYVTSPYTNSVYEVNTSSLTVTSTISVGSDPKGIAITPDGQKLFVPHGSDNQVYVINTATNTVATTIACSNSPSYIALNPAGTRAFVSCEAAAEVKVINTQNNSIISTINLAPTSDFPRGITVHPDGSKLYVSEVANDTVTVINTSNYSILARIGVSSTPTGLNVTPDGSQLYVCHGINNKLSIINTTTNTLDTTITSTAFSSTYSYGNFMSTYNADTVCPSNITIIADSTTPHNWFAITDALPSTNFYRWYWGDGTSDIAATPTHTYSAPGYYNICLMVKDNSGCINITCDNSNYLNKTEDQMVSITVVTEIPVGYPILENPDWKVFPNPTQGVVSIKSNQSNTLLNYRVISLHGQTLISGQVWNEKVDISELPAGFYSLVLESESGKMAFPISKINP